MGNNYTKFSNIELKQPLNSQKFFNQPIIKQSIINIKKPIKKDYHFIDSCGHP